MKEYMIKIWGGAWNKDTIPSIKEDLGIDEGNYYFNTKEEREVFMRKLHPYKKFGIVCDLEEGEMSHKDTIATMDLCYKGVRYPIEYNLGKEYKEENAEFYFFDGNMSCDCNKSSLIQRQRNEDFPDLECGDEIEIENFAIKYV